MRTKILTAVAAVLGGLAGAFGVAVLRLGANNSCLDVLRREVTASCAVPGAPAWALVLGAAVGAVIGGLVVLLLSRRT